MSVHILCKTYPWTILTQNLICFVQNVPNAQIDLDGMAGPDLREMVRMRGGAGLTEN